MLAVAYMVLGTFIWYCLLLVHRTRNPTYPAATLLPYLIISYATAMGWFYPSITGAALSVFSCQSMDGEASVPGEVGDGFGLTRSHYSPGGVLY